MHIIADDMIFAAASEIEHDAILQKVMDTAQRNHIKFNKEKIQSKVAQSDTWDMLSPQGSETG